MQFVHCSGAVFGLGYYLPERLFDSVATSEQSPLDTTVRRNFLNRGRERDIDLAKVAFFS